MASGSCAIVRSDTEMPGAALFAALQVEFVAGGTMANLVSIATRPPSAR
ncbi:MAG: hypothetical protein ACLT98_04510 [Eggerthellaceae bacterium]